jgi:hypothetical protein
LAQILDTIFEPESGELYRPVSNDSMVSASSSLTNTGSLNFAKPTAYPILARIPGEDTSDESQLIQLTQVVIDFKIETVNFKMSQSCKKKNSNEDEVIFNFILSELNAEFTKRTFDMKGKFNLGKKTLAVKGGLKV